MEPGVRGSAASSKIPSPAARRDGRSPAAAWRALPGAAQSALAVVAATLVWVIAVRPVVGDSPLATFALIVLTATAVALVAWRTSVNLARLGAEARALAGGEDAAFRTPIGWNRELGALDTAFGALALATAEREEIMRSDILQLRAVEQLKDDFVSTVSHELRTPLTAMRGALGLVLGGAAGAVEPRTRDLLQIAMQNTERLIRLINDILDIERMRDGQLVTRHQPCDLADVLRTTAEPLTTMAQEARVSVQVDLQSGSIVVGDADRLVQVFTNLISNAIRYSPAGDAVAVCLRAVAGTARVTVSDRGPGIPDDFRARIFGKFQQAAPMGAETGGTGLGLAIARAIVEEHGGTIRFESPVDGGTTFVVELPCAPAVTATAAANGQYRVLILDGDAGVREVLASLCAPFARATGAQSCGDAWTLLHADRHDAIILDPEADGDCLALVRRLRAEDRYAGIPVLVFSTREWSPDELAGVTLAPSHAFVKARHREQDLLRRLKAVLAVRSPRPMSEMGSPAPR
jgi:signal transduction histidine kinase